MIEQPISDKNTRHITISNDMKEVSRTRNFLEGICKEYCIDREVFKMLNLAMEEWVANVINYAYDDGVKGEVELTACMDDGRLTITVKDRGTPFDPTKQAAVDVDAGLEERTIGGLGIHLVISIMDTVAYRRTTDGYNEMTLIKKIY